MNITRILLKEDTHISSCNGEENFTVDSNDHDTIISRTTNLKGGILRKSKEMVSDNSNEALTVSQWGDEMNMPKGSFINITNPDDMYAINPRDFHDTYTRSEEAQKIKA